ncbi:MAG: type I 3-dehydroquinate dehydratase [Treponema sp.]|nr:type I 3-dehydroquinate dehydratase [Treponema sp.]
MSKICLCLTEKTISRNLELIEKYHKYIDMAELRVDCLHPDENFYIRQFPRQAGIPVILTIRRKQDGGFYSSGEGSRVALLSRGLAFAEADKRYNFAYVDLEEDLEVPGLEEAVRTFGTRIIRSYHNFTGIGNIYEKIKSLRRIGDEIAKIAVMPQDLNDVMSIYNASRETLGLEKIIVGMGPYGLNTRILSEKLGSFLSYTSETEGSDQASAVLGHISPRDLVEKYRFRDISSATDIYGVVGFPLSTTYSPRIYNTVFSREKIDAVYIPFPAHNLDYFLELAEDLNIKGAAVTIPYKEEIIHHLSNVSGSVQIAGACNTIKALGMITRSLPGESVSKVWSGTNTDTLGFTESLLSFLERKHLRGQKITVIGAGGAARAAVSEIFRLKGKCLILNRNAVRARELALNYGYAWGGLDSQALDSMERYSDIIIQTTPVGTFPNTEDDPFELYHFNGHETVMDLIYNPMQTAFLKRALTAGCRVLNGMDMLLRQAKHQYEYILERDFPEHLIPALLGLLKK